MKKNLYYRDVHARENKITEGLYFIFSFVASYFKMLLEVFIRRQFGRRYFSLATAITVAVIMLLIPIVRDRLPFWSGFGRVRIAPEEAMFWLRYTSWYVFTLAYCYFAYRRWQEVRQSPSVFDFGHYSKSSGYIDKRFFDIVLFGKKPTVRQVETLYEPGLFFLIGLALWIINQPLGGFLMFSSFVYSMSYFADYKRGDDWVLNKIDKMILDEEFENAFVNDLGAEKTRGVRFYFDKPSTKDLRERLKGLFNDSADDDENTIAI